MLWPASAATPAAAAAVTAAPAAAPAARDVFFPEGLAAPTLVAPAVVPTGWAVATAPAFAARELEVCFSRSSRGTAWAVGKPSAGGAVAACPPVVGARVLTSWYAGGAPPLGFLLAFFRGDLEGNKANRFADRHVCGSIVGYESIANACVPA